MRRQKEKNTFMDSELPIGTALNPGMMVLNEHSMDEFDLFKRESSDEGDKSRF
ncbi:hypothetical protein ACFO4N_07455 [Camelliibacillus cellulosilyticus]|uniref:Uncharacterized protein n=1 Tax=Camelliibacillus cellulosilyticus TaxID=2174486 RepID=A0ABV9GNR6_9BACL